ncbi:MAG: ABC transporter permease [Clostridia bacterium]|nr:ABC transporter permease [Clostridia bacterium]
MSKKRRQSEYGKTMWQEAWFNFRHNRMGMIGLVMLILLVLVAVFAEQLAPYGYDDQNLIRRFIPPCAEFPFGTDHAGRDILSRIMHGAKYSLLIGTAAASFSCIVGVVLGAIAGFFNDYSDNIIMRLMDMLMAIPSTLLAISIIAALGNGIQNVVLAVGIGSVPQYARQVRASVLSIKDQEYIEAATCIGSSKLRTLFRHVLPNCLAPIIVTMTISVSGGILAAASLSFIGLGIQPPTPEWGAMLSVGRPYIRDSWWVVTFPGIAIMYVIFALNMVGDGLRDVLDPRLKK